MRTPFHRGRTALRTSLLGHTDDSARPLLDGSVEGIAEFAKTQSGTIIRRTVEATSEGEDLDDTSSIENHAVLDGIETVR